MGSFYNCFSGCTNLRELSFPNLTNALSNSFTGMLNRCTDVNVHFPASMESTMSSWADVTSGFGGTRTTVLFDL